VDRFSSFGGKWCELMCGVHTHHDIMVDPVACENCQKLSCQSAKFGLCKCVEAGGPRRKLS